jgi:CRISPR-associated endoribonuclease Cas6
MRLHLSIKTSNEIIPFDHQPLLTGTIHKWLGMNKEHGSVSLYSFSWLNGGKKVPAGLHFGKETSFFISSHMPDMIKSLISGIQNDPTMFSGLTVSEIIIQEDPELLNQDTFLPASPIFIKRKVGEKVDHIEYMDPRANACLKETLLTKMVKAGIPDDDFEIRFDTTYPKAGTKKINYNNVGNRANWCPVIIEGNPQVKLFAWNVGLGNSTGIGFGAIK